MEKIKTLVLGASENPSRYSHLAVLKLSAHGHAVVAIGKKKGSIEGIEIGTGETIPTGIDTVTLYLNAKNQEAWYDYIFSLHPRRIIFNPGAENPELFSLARQKDILPVEACPLVLLSTGQY